MAWGEQVGMGEKGRGGLTSSSHPPFSSNFVSVSQNKTAGWLHETRRGEWRIGDRGRVHGISASLLAGTPPTGFTPLLVLVSTLGLVMLPVCVTLSPPPCHREVTSVSHSQCCVSGGVWSSPSPCRW